MAMAMAMAMANDDDDDDEEEEAEEAQEDLIPECSVCLQPYDEHLIVPRVLSCGHSLCDPCISTLSHDHRRPPSSSFLRCPECNQPSKIGHSPFPRNVELLRLIVNINRQGSGSRQSRRAAPLRPHPLRRHRSDQIRRPSPVYDASSSSSSSSSLGLYQWILPQASARICRPPDEGQVFLLRSGSNERLEGCTALFVDMHKLWPGLKLNRDDPSEVDYVQKIRSSLDSLSRYEAQDLFHLLMLQEGVFGFWMNQENHLFFVCNALPVFDGKPSTHDSSEADTEVRVNNSLVMRAMEVCEIFMQLHNKHVIAGLISPQCLCSTEFLHIKLNVSAILSLRQTLREFSNGSETKVELPWESIGANSVRSPFCYGSPEFLQGLKELDTFCQEKLTCKNDSWNLGCLLCYLLFDATPWDGLQIDELMSKLEDRKEYADSWMQKRVGKMDGDSIPVHLTKLLLQCFSLDPEERPSASEMWQYFLCIQTSPDISSVSSVSQGPNRRCGAGYSYCLVLGCSLIKETISAEDSNGQTSESSSVRALEQLAEPEKSPNSDDFTEVQKDITVDGHLGEVTCLALSGKYLLSGSFDKTICVWSLEDYTLVKTLKGHSQMVMALVINQQSSLCISGDYGGELCVWNVESGENSSIVKWHHHQDWRYSGVASLALSSDFLYSGSGDRTIKVWSLQDYGLITAMDGHKSVVSALVINEGILYSGSWDGTIRLWLRTDHSPLAVLSEVSDSGPLRALEISGNLVLAGYHNGAIQVWKDEIYVNTIAAHSGVISSLCISGETLYSGSWDGTIKACKLDNLFDDATIRTVRTYDATVTSMACDENMLAVGLSTKTVHVITSNF